MKESIRKSVRITKYATRAENPNNWYIVDADGKVLGRLRPSGLRPKFMDKLEASGIHLPPSIFGVGNRQRY